KSASHREFARAAYQAPEQIRGETQISPKADLYSLGCLLFQMITGQPPFVADGLDELVEQQLNAPPPRVTTLALDCPIWLDAIVAQLLEKEPSRRPHSAEAVGLALAEAKKKAASGTSVAQHALGGFSALQLPVDKQEARKLFGSKQARREAREDATPIWERPW